MLLETKIVHIPALRERQADLNEYGHLGLKVRATFGEAAIDAGTPDFGQNDARTDAVDAIANILHHLIYEHGLSPDEAVEVFDSAETHFRAELDPEEP
jgi:hypothetical protein